MRASSGLSPRNDPQVKARLREFLATDNVTNFLYVARAWCFSFAAALTSFPFFMALRQVIQHGNGDRGRLSNTRVFRATRRSDEVFIDDSVLAACELEDPVGDPAAKSATP